MPLPAPALPRGAPPVSLVAPPLAASPVRSPPSATHPASAPHPSPGSACRTGTARRQTLRPRARTVSPGSESSPSAYAPHLLPLKPAVLSPNNGRTHLSETPQTVLPAEDLVDPDSVIAVDHHDFPACDDAVVYHHVDGLVDRAAQLHKRAR